MRPFVLSGGVRSHERCGSRIAWPLRWIANPVVFHLGSSNLPCRAINSGHELSSRTITGDCDICLGVDLRRFSDVFCDLGTNSQKTFRDVTVQ